MKNPRSPSEHIREEIAHWSVTQRAGRTLHRTMVVKRYIQSVISTTTNHHNQIVSYPPQADMIPMQKYRAQRIPPAEEKKHPYRSWSVFVCLFFFLNVIFIQKFEINPRNNIPKLECDQNRRLIYSWEKGRNVVMQKPKSTEEFLNEHIRRDLINTCLHNAPIQLHNKPLGGPFCLNCSEWHMAQPTATLSFVTVCLIGLNMWG